MVGWAAHDRFGGVIIVGGEVVRGLKAVGQGVGLIIGIVYVFEIDELVDRGFGDCDGGVGGQFWTSSSVEASVPSIVVDGLIQTSGVLGRGEEEDFV